MRIKQLNLDCCGCTGPLNNAKGLIEIMKNSARAAGAKVIGSKVQNYPKYGLTAIVFLAESHILVSTYPEINYAVVEVFMCNNQMNPAECGRLIAKYLKSARIVSNEFFHSISKTDLRVGYRASARINKIPMVLRQKPTPTNNF